MLDIIFATKFVHVVAAAAMFGTWLCLAVFMVLAHRSGNTSVVALTSRFVVNVEFIVMAAAMALPLVSGFPLAWAIGITPLNELWVDLALALYVVILACWIAALRIEMKIRDLTRNAALAAVPLPAAYPRLFRLWSGLAGVILAGMVAIFALMIWQPRLD
jgi:uncharacterized membrane protein